MTSYSHFIIFKSYYTPYQNYDNRISKTLFPFFEGLLPEGWLLELTTQTLEIDPDDKFELLLHTGSDTVGAVTVRPEELAHEIQINQKS